MVITHRGKWDATTDSGKDVGQVANWVIKTSAAGGIPNATATSWIRYGMGIDEVQEIAQIANEFALIKRSGAWYTLSTAIENSDDPTIKSWLLDNDINPDSQEDVEKAFKYQGMERLTTFLENNEAITNFVYDQIKEILL